jgi:dihydrofolate reductase
MERRKWLGKVFIGTSVDGFIARESGDIDWLTSRGEAAGDTGYDAFMAGIDHLVMGRVTYETVLEFGFWPYEGKTVLVLSTTLAPDDPRVRVVRSIAKARDVLDGAARGVYVDGGQVVQAFLREDLIDEITITRVPVLIGVGKPLFGTLPTDVDLELLEQRTLGGGVVQTRYRVRLAAA